MIDIHNHSLYGIDDGSPDIEESIHIIKKQYELGFNKVILTPHYILGSKYCSDNEEKVKLMNLLYEELNKNEIPVQLYLGNEIFINNEINEYILDNKICSINDSKYILVEFSLYNILNNIDDLLYDLVLQGYKVIIAHPERYTFLQENYELIDKIKDENIYFQCNYSSIVGKYGKKAQKLMIYLLKNNLVSFLGTDVHRSKSSVITDFNKAKKKIIKLIGQERFDLLSNDNIESVLNNREIK